MSKMRFIKNANRLHNESTPKTANLVNLDAAAHAGIKTIPVTQKGKFLGGLGLPDGLGIENVKSGTLLTSYEASLVQAEKTGLDPNGQQLEYGTKILLGKEISASSTIVITGGEDSMIYLMKEPKTGPIQYENPDSGIINFYPFSISSGVSVPAVPVDFNITIDGVDKLIDASELVNKDYAVNSTVLLDQLVTDLNAVTLAGSGILWSRDGNYLKLSVPCIDYYSIASNATTFALKLTKTSSSSPASDLVKAYNGSYTWVADGLTAKTYDGTAGKTAEDLAADLNDKSAGRIGVFCAIGNKVALKSAGRIIVLANDATALLGFTVDAVTKFDSANQGAIEVSFAISEGEVDSSNQKYKDYTAGGKSKADGYQIL